MGEKESLKQESSRAPLTERIMQNIHVAQKFLNAGGSMKAIEDSGKDCGTNVGLDDYLERMVEWLGINDSEEQVKHGE